MQRRLRGLGRRVLWLGLLLGSASMARASHLITSLTVEGLPQAATAGTDTMPPESGKNPRSVVHVKRGEMVTLRWSVKNSSASQKLEKLLVHVFITREGQIGQKEVPDRSKGYAWETIYATSLDPGKETHGDTEVPVDQPGTYLVRVESMFTDRDHEHFSAVDLVIE